MKFLRRWRTLKIEKLLGAIGNPSDNIETIEYKFICHLLAEWRKF